MAVGKLEDRSGVIRQLSDKPPVAPPQAASDGRPLAGKQEPSSPSSDRYVAARLQDKDALPPPQLSVEQARRAVEALALEEAQKKLLLERVQGAQGREAQQAALGVIDAAQKLDPQASAKLLKVAATVGPEALIDLNRLAQSGKLQNPDSQGHSLLDNLDALASRKPENLHASLTAAGVTPEQILSSVVSEAAHPERINQSKANTCAVATLQYSLVQGDPSEYARLIAGLSSSDGKVAMAGGDELNIQPEYYQYKTSRRDPKVPGLPDEEQDQGIRYSATEPGDTRSPSEILFQNAAIEHANGADTHNAANDTHTSPTGQTYSGGVVSSARTAQQLFATDYEDWETQKSPDVARAQLGFLKSDFSHSGRPIQVKLDLGTIGDGQTHLLTFVEVKDGRVYLRNPYGNEVQNDPALKLEDAEQGIYSISEEEFVKRSSAVTMSSSDYDAYERQPAPADVAQERLSRVPA